jgi:hypothetical protein
VSGRDRAAQGVKRRINAMNLKIKVYSDYV